MDVTQTPHVFLCSVCIATYRRPQLLAKLIESLLQQTLAAHIGLEVIVVDNDAEASARAIVQCFENAKYPIIYSVEPRKNISHARNKGVQLCTGDYILFIDDDETASQEWVSSLLHTLHAFEADGVFGRVISDFHPETAEWVKSIYLFNRPGPATGSTAHATRTSNCLIKAALIQKDIHGPFDESYGITGGEDTHLFGRLRQKGARFVNCYEGWVAEFIPLERTQKRWILKRAYRTGNLFGRRKIELAQQKYRARSGNVVVGLLNMLLGIALTIVYLPSQKKRWHWFLKTAANWGRLLSTFDVRVNGY